MKKLILVALFCLTSMSSFADNNTNEEHKLKAIGSLKSILACPTKNSWDGPGMLFKGWVMITEDCFESNLEEALEHLKLSDVPAEVLSEVESIKEKTPFVGMGGIYYALRLRGVNEYINGPFGAKTLVKDAIKLIKAN